MYHYFVSYSYMPRHGFGFGSTEIVSRQKIGSYEDVRAIAEAIEDNGRTPNVVILNFQLLAGGED